VQVPVYMVFHPDIVYIVIPVQVQVIHFRIFLIKLPFKTFQRLRLLKKLQNCVEIEVISRQIEFFFF
jgi:hypothetical protein